MFFSLLLDYLHNKHIEFALDVNTADLVSFRIGGTAKIAIFPKNTKELVDLIEFVKNEKYFIIGNGTNCYFSSGMYDGIVIATKHLNKSHIKGNTIVAECGASISKLCKMALGSSLSGIEFAYGIPGSVGGAIYMNASAFGGDFSQIVKKSKVLDIESGRIIELSKEEHCFSEKFSVFKEKKHVILESELLLQSCDKMLIHSKMSEYIDKRKISQPLDLPSAGSVFLKPKDGYASYMIDKSGLKGFTVGGAQVSEKHAGFIVNVNSASATDVQELINVIKAKVYKEFSVELKEEIIYID